LYLGKLPTIENLFTYILTYSYLLPIVVFFFFVRKIGFPKRLTIILIYSLLIFLFIFIYEWVPKGFYRRLHWTLYTFVEYCTFSSILWLSISNKKFKNLILVVSVGFVSFQVIYLLSVNLAYLDSTSVGIETILVFIYSFYFLYQEF